MASPERLPFRRRPFLSREPLRQWRQMLADGPGRVLMIEGRGGIGKTFFLNHISPIFVAQGDGCEPGAPLMVGAVDHGDPQRVLPLDMIYADMALPLTIEEVLVDCVERAPAFRTADLFAAYKAARADYERIRRHLNFHDLRASEQRLHAAFFDGWERLEHRCAAPLVISFDTCEYLERTRIGDPTKLAESRDATGRGMGVRAQFFEWVQIALAERRLRRTHFIFCGRGVAGSELFRHLDAASGGRVLVEEIEGLDPEQAGAYLELERRDLGDPQRASTIAHLISEGLPIKLDLLYELLEDDAAWCAERLFSPAADLSTGDLRDRFYSQALRRFFDPARYLDLPAPAQPLGLALVCLAYARCGATIGDLQDFIASYDGAPVAPELLRAYLDGHALVKKLSPRVRDSEQEPALIRREPQYFLHDQLWVDIDAIFGDTGTNADVWTFLAARRSAAIAACLQDRHARRRIELMCEHLIVAMLHDPVGSYAFYSSYVDQVLRQRDIDSAIVISETFWRTLYYETSGSYGRFFPVLSAILGSRAIDLDVIRRDEQVRHLRVLSALSLPERREEGAPRNGSAGRAEQAAQQAHALRAELRPHFAADRYLWATCTLGLIDVLLTYEPYSPSIREAIVELIAGLPADEAPPTGPPRPDWRSAETPLLAQRRDLILARAYRYRGELNEALRHFADAISYMGRCIAALDRYAAGFCARLNDDVAREYALAQVDLASYLTRVGQSRQAQELLGRVRTAIVGGQLSAYDSAVTHARYALISPHGAELTILSTTGGGPTRLSAESRAALDKAEATGVRRAVETARLSHLAALRLERKSAEVRHNPLRRQAYDAQLDEQIGVLVSAGELLVSPDMHYDIAHEIIRVYRDRFAHQYAAPPVEPDLWPLQQAYRIFVASGTEQKLRQALREQPYRRVQYADLVETRVSLFTALLGVLQRVAREHDPSVLEGSAVADQIARVGDGAPDAPRSSDDLSATLAEIAAILHDDLGNPRRSPAQDRFIYVVLGKIALQRGLLLSFAEPERRDMGAALAEFTAALACANLFSLNPFRERDAFRSLITLVCGERSDERASVLAAATALPRTPPAELLAHIPAADRDELHTAWRQALRQLPAPLRRLGP